MTDAAPSPPTRQPARRDRLAAALSRFRLWPRSLSGRLVAVIVTVLILSHLISMAIMFDDRRQSLRAAAREEAVDRIAAVTRLIEQAPPAMHRQIVEAASSADLRFRLSPRPSVLPDQMDRRIELYFRDALAARLGRPPEAVRLAFWAGWDGDRRWFDPDRRAASGGRDARRWWDEDDNRHHDFHKRPPVFGATASIRLANGPWLEAATVIRGADRLWGLPALISLTVSMVALVLLVVWIVRRTMRPLKHLTHAADALGRGETPARTPESGPDDIRHLIVAFNRMQERLDRFVRDRMQMLAMMSHDLRTPITTLRLRAELLDDTEAKAKILQTLDELSAMAEEVLAFIRSETVTEESRDADVASLIQAIADDRNDLGDGGSINLDLPRRATLRCRASSLKRAFANLIDNALRYGGNARIALSDGEGRLTVTIDDNGPGMPEDALERAFDPFVRLETSRSRETGGVGLGLSIARSIVQSHGGRITLENRRQGGLRATVILPKGR